MSKKSLQELSAKTYREYRSSAKHDAEKQQAKQQAHANARDFHTMFGYGSSKSGKWYDDHSKKNIQHHLDSEARHRNKEKKRERGIQTATKLLKKKSILQRVKSMFEEKMSPEQMSKREDIVMSMKKKMKDFKARYGSRAKDVLYATATKMAMQEQALREGRVKEDNKNRKRSLMIALGNSIRGGTSNKYAALEKGRKLFAPQKKDMLVAKNEVRTRPKPVVRRRATPEQIRARLQKESAPSILPHIENILREQFFPHTMNEGNKENKAKKNAYTDSLGTGKTSHFPLLSKQDNMRKTGRFQLRRKVGFYNPSVEDKIKAKSGRQERLDYMSRWNNLGEGNLDEGSKENKAKKNAVVADTIRRKINPGLMPSLAYGRQDAKQTRSVEDQIKAKVDAKASPLARMKRDVIRGDYGKKHPEMIKRMTRYGLKNSVELLGSILRETEVKGLTRMKRATLLQKLSKAAINSRMRAKSSPVRPPVKR